MCKSTEYILDEGLVSSKLMVLIRGTTLNVIQKKHEGKDWIIQIHRLHGRVRICKYVTTSNFDWMHGIGIQLPKMSLPDYICYN